MVYLLHKVVGTKYKDQDI